VLRAHQGQQLLHKSKIDGTFQEYGLVFASPLGAPLNPMAITRVFQSFSKRLGLQKVGLAKGWA